MSILLIFTCIHLLAYLITQTADLFLLKAESRFGISGTSLLVAIALLLVASMYVMPRFDSTHHGYFYAQLSQAPFDFTEENPLRYRILGPLLANLIHLPARAFVVVPWTFLILTIAGVYFWSRHKSYSPGDSLLMSLLMTFSSAVLIPLIAPGYTDILSYFFLFLCFTFISNKYLFSLFLSLALFNHENALFILPSLWMYSILENRENRWDWLLTIVAAIVALIPYMLYRRYVDQHTTVPYDLSYYLNTESIKTNFGLVARLAPAGAFFAFKVLWFIPIAYVAYCIKQKELIKTLPILLMILCVSAQLLFAYDITRLFALAFMAILLSADQLRKPLGSQWSTYVTALLFFNLFIPQYFISQEGLNDMFPPIIYFLENALK